MNIAVILSLSLSLSACGKGNDADWEDTLPSASTRKNTETVQVITEDTNPPISLDESALTTVTTVTTTTARFATTTSGDDKDEDLDDIERVPAVPSVPFTDYTITTASVPYVTAADTDTSSYSLTESSTSSNTTATSDTTSSTTATTTSSGDGVLVKPNYKDSSNLSRPYSYNYLNATQKYVYDSLINAMENYKTDLTIPAAVNVTDQDYKAVYQLLYNDETSIFYIGTLINYKVTSGRKDIVIQYKYTQDEIIKMQREIDYNVNKILAKITDDMTEYDIVKLFFDEIASTCTYNASSSNCSDIYGCLVNKSAICGGFAKAFSYLCSKAGIESLLITGEFDEPHMWNMVKIDNEWYHVDVTSGIVKNNTSRYVRYDYFCVNDDFIKSGRTIYQQSYLYPIAIYDTYNYFVINNLVAKNYDDAVKILTSEIIRVSSEKSSVIQFYCSSDEIYNLVYNNLFTRTSDNALSILDSQYSKAANKYNTNALKYNADAQTRVIKIFLEYTS